VYPALRHDHRLLLLVGSGALLGFLPHNWKPARMFLGDNGSYTVGTLLTAVIVELGIAGRGPQDMIAGAAVATVFLVDLGSTLLRRRRAGVPLFVGDRNHTYDRLHDAGWPVPRVALTSALVNGASALGVALLATISVPLAAVAAVAWVLVLIGVAVR
jgi:UDP-GlcNAc:undecaprenyl-phosphate GlcNAc-1-phosphate transferase